MTTHQPSILLTLLSVLFISILYLYFKPDIQFPNTIRNQLTPPTSIFESKHGGTGTESGSGSNNKILESILAKLQTQPNVDFPDCKSYVEGTIPDKMTEQINMLNTMFSQYTNRMSRNSIILVPMNTERVSYFQSQDRRHQFIKYDTFFQEMAQLYTVRIHFEWFIESMTPKDMLTTTDRETVGYPCKNQWIPLPDQVVPTGRLVLQQMPKESPDTVRVYLNYATIMHSSLILGDMMKCRVQVDDANQPTTLENVPVKFDEYRPITGSSNYMNQNIVPVEAPASRSPLTHRENGLFTWDVSGVPVQWITVQDDHIGVPTSNPTVTGTPNGQSTHNWLFDLSRGDPNHIFT